LMLGALACTFDLGYTFVCYNKLEMAVNQGARFASMVPYDSSTTTPSAMFLSGRSEHGAVREPYGGQHEGTQRSDGWEHQTSCNIRQWSAEVGRGFSHGIYHQRPFRPSCAHW
jgi:hypothetical protein